MGWLLSRAYLHLYHRYRVYGRKRIPNPRPGMLIAGNHASFVDPLAIGSAFYFPVWYLARTTLFESSRFFGWLIASVNSIPISRERLDLKTIRQTKALCEQGKSVVIFPEGTRSKDGELQKGLAGVGLFVDKIGADILPVYVEGSFQAFSRKSRFPRPVRIRVNIGAPLKAEQWHDIPRGRERYQAIADDIMKAIEGLKEELERR